MEAQIAKLKETAERLNSASDRLSQAVDVLNARLKTIGLGVSAWVDVRTDGTSTVQVGYTKLNKKWQVAIRALSLIDGVVTDESPFNEAPRHYRVLAVYKLHDLMNELSRVAVGMIANLNEASDALYAYVQALKASLGERQLEELTVPSSRDASSSEGRE